MIASNVIGVHVDPPENGGRRLVITDIHGCALTFERLLEKIELTTDDQLFLLGDFINRGPRSQQVIDKVLQLEEEGYNIFPLMGNHEETVLHIIQERPDELKLLLRSRNSLDLLNKEGRIRKRSFRFMRRLPYYYQLDKFYLVHAGFNLKIEKPFTDAHAMAWLRNFKIEDTLNGRRIYFGHTPTKLSRIKAAAENDAVAICLDNGCSHKYLGKEYGRLVCYDLDSRKVFKQKNLDQ
jgi:serine/threonine protein phosphatase 1